MNRKNTLETVAAAITARVCALDDGVGEVPMLAPLASSDWEGGVESVRDGEIDPDARGTAGVMAGVAVASTADPLKDSRELPDAEGASTVVGFVP
jgi:hypothetical protein